MTLFSNRPLLSLMASIFSMLAITACQSDDDIEDFDFDKPADHTVLLYIAGDSNISSSLEKNVIDAQKAIKDSVGAGAINLLVFKDNEKSGDNLPMLYWVHGNMKHKLDTIIIKKWDKELDSTDPAVITEVVNLGFSKFNTSIKGLVMGSHASGWAPKMNGIAQAAPRPSFGLDQDTPDKKLHSCELQDLSDALLRCPHLDYLIMDCCHFGIAEVAYQLRDVAHYMVGSPCEVQDNGMPYDKVITRLAKCHRSQDLPEALTYSMRCYFDEYKQNKGATISLYNLEMMEALAYNYRNLLHDNTSRLREIAQASPSTITDWQLQFQHFGRDRNGVRYRYHFYDLRDMVRWLGETQPAEAKQVEDALSQVVLAEFHSSHFLHEIQIDRCCGLAVTIPEVLELAKDGPNSIHFNYLSYETLISAYRKTDWGSYMGY